LHVAQLEKISLAVAEAGPSKGLRFLIRKRPALGHTVGDKTLSDCATQKLGIKHKTAVNKALSLTRAVARLGFATFSPPQ
jgi:hypothetical protein